MEKVIKKNIQGLYTLDNNFDSTKFLKLRMRVCHDGINKNDTYFSLDSINKAQKSIYNIPILARVIQNENGEYQFSGHDMTIETNAFDENDIKFIYQEVPIGFIPEDCNYSVEQENGLNYVYVDGYIWKEYSNYAQEIIERDKEVNLSMEINVQFSQPITFENGEETISIEDYSYTAITLLGNDVEPAMNNACAKLVTFSINKDRNDIIKEMDKELKQIFENSDNTNNKTNENIYSYESSLNNVEQTIQNLLYTRNDDNSKFFVFGLVTQPNGETFVQYFDRTFKQTYMQKYTINNDVISFCGEPVKLNLQNITSNMIEDYNNLISELSELRTFKQNTLLQEENNKKTEILNKWNKYLSENENFQKLKEKCDELSINEIEIQCKCIFADNQLSIKQKNSTNNIDKSDTNIINFNIDSNKNHSSVENNIDLFMKNFSKI